MKKVTVVLCLVMMAGPAWAGSIANPQIPVTAGTPESEGLPMPSGGGYAVTPAPQKLYVPLTDEQQELPIAAADPGVDYVPGIEVPAGGTWPKLYTDQVPAVLPPIRPAQPAALAPIPDVPQETLPGVLPPIRPVTLGQ